MIYTIFLHTHTHTSYAEYYVVILDNTYWKTLPANVNVYNLILCHNEGVDGAASKVCLDLHKP